MSQVRKLAAILAADVAGYSRLMADDERATVETLNAYRKVFRDRVAAHGGRVVDSPGDALLAEFPSAVEGVQSAGEIQQELGRRNNQLAEHRRMRFRIGLNLGDVIEEDGALYGDAVNVAARLEELAEPGNICISGTAFDEVDGNVPLRFKFTGEHSVKNIPKPVRAYRMLQVASSRHELAQWQRKRLVLGALKLGAALILIATIVLVVRWFSTPTEESPQDPVLAIPGGPSVAVLAFENLSGDPEQEYFADGISEDIITSLSRFRNLKVLGRNSTFRYKGQPIEIREIGRELNANYVLEGRVRRDVKRIRVTAQLLDARDGSYVWGETYDRDPTASALFDAQEDIATRVATAIADTHGAIALERVREVRRKAPASLDSYECVLLAQEYQRVLSKAKHSAALTCLEQVLERDPTYADAWAWLGNMYYEGSVIMGYLEDIAPAEALKKAEDFAQRALGLDPNNQWARANLALMHFYRRNGPSGVIEAERALILNPNNTQVLADLAWRFGSAGHWERAVALMEKAIALNPNPPGWYYGLLFVNHYRLGQWTQAQPYARKAELPDLFWSYVYLAAINAQLGRNDEANDAVNKLIALKPDFENTARQEFENWFYSNPELVLSLIDGMRKAGLDIPERNG